MFISDTHLPQLLKPADYHSQERYDAEMAALFHRGWHVVGAVGDLPNAGDYFTRQIGDYHVLVRNFGDRVQAFLNVCCHRYCEIRSESHGHSDEFSCQYHGWVFDADGNTRRIPDAPSFKPLSKGMVGLTRFRTEVCGSLIFVSLDDEAPDLAEWLGPSHAVYERLSSAPYRQVKAYDFSVDVNWKAIVEIGLESYHVECVHTSTFQATPDADDCSHELEPSYTVFRTTSSEPRTFNRWLEDQTARALGQEPTRVYTHHSSYPSFAFAFTDALSVFQTVLPTGPTTSRVLYNLYLPELPNPLSVASLAQRFVTRGIGNYYRRVIGEDLRVLPSVQRGARCPRPPRGGLISAREERLFHFQQHVNDALERHAAEAKAEPELVE